MASRCVFAGGLGRVAGFTSAGCGVWGVECKGVGCGVWGVGCGVWGVGCGVWGVGGGVWGVGICKVRKGGSGRR